jgi:hypothetical protein
VQADARVQGRGPGLCAGRAALGWVDGCSWVLAGTPSACWGPVLPQAAAKPFPSSAMPTVCWPRGPPLLTLLPATHARPQGELLLDARLLAAPEEPGRLHITYSGDTAQARRARQGAEGQQEGNTPASHAPEPAG